MTNTETNQAIQLFTQVTESTKSIYELTARVDERVKLVSERQATLDNKIESMVASHNQIVSRVVTLETRDYVELQKEVDKLTDLIQAQESRLAILEDNKKGMDWKLGQVADFVIKLVWVVVACYVVYKLGLSTPPIP